MTAVKDRIVRGFPRNIGAEIEPGARRFERFACMAAAECLRLERPDPRCGGRAGICHGAGEMHCLRLGGLQKDCHTRAGFTADRFVGQETAQRGAGCNEPRLRLGGIGEPGEKGRALFNRQAALRAGTDFSPRSQKSPAIICSPSRMIGSSACSFGACWEQDA